MLDPTKMPAFAVFQNGAFRILWTARVGQRLLERGQIDGLKIGRDWFVLIDALDAYMVNRPKPGPKPRKE